MCEHSSICSIDNLVELGLEMALARNLVTCFNQNLDSAMLPMEYTIQNAHVSIDNHDVGPLNEVEIRQLFCEGKLFADTLAWIPGMPEWQTIEQIPAILKIIALTPSKLLANEEHPF